eukprot:TRINITY_DN35642_c0_g1_i1.p1 TRINITY_DN35642_c0_g1~~TRINITY_DN35642_c0_g1_i1.p1  ORF type:complete len:158 (-),score=13.72 TRINITY_DN35642_c0_g1_i1:8-481(-)
MATPSPPPTASQGTWAKELWAPTGWVGGDLIEGGVHVPVYMRRLRVLFAEASLTSSRGQCVLPQYPYLGRGSRRAVCWSAAVDKEIRAAVAKGDTNWCRLLLDPEKLDKYPLLFDFTPRLLEQRRKYLESIPSTENADSVQDAAVSRPRKRARSPQD